MVGFESRKTKLRKLDNEMAEIRHVMQALTRKLHTLQKEAARVRRAR